MREILRAFIAELDGMIEKVALKVIDRIGARNEHAWAIGVVSSVSSNNQFASVWLNGDTVATPNIPVAPHVGALSAESRVLVLRRTPRDLLVLSRLTAFSDGNTIQILEPWHSATLVNWQQAPGFAPVSYKIDPYGTVQLRGAVVNGTANDTVAFTLPLGFRPPYTARFHVARQGRLGYQLTVNTNGDCVISTVGSLSDWHSFDSVFFNVNAN